jgi:hypothetical protein
MTTIAPRAASSTRISAEKLQSIPCPNLRALVNEGWLKPDDTGLVDLKDLDAALNRLGVEPLPRKVLVTGAERATHEAVAEQLGAQAKGAFNIFRLTDSFLDHAGDTRVLRGGFNKDRLDWLLSFANEQGRLGIAEMARAQKEARTDEKTKFFDKAVGVAELTALVKVYGTPDATGRKSISVDGVRSLYEQARFPDEWRARMQADGTSPQRTSMARLIGGIVEMAFAQVGTAAGRARLGMELSTSKDTPLSNTSAIGLANALCPAGPPVATPKTQTDRAHASVA